MSLQLETERLLLRPFEIQDAEGMFELYADPEVIRFTADKAFNDLAAVEDFITAYDQYDKYQMGRLSVLIKESGEYIGWCGLKYLADKNKVDIGYRLIKRYRGKGYTTEAARVCMDYGFHTLNLDEIIGTAMKDNTPSVNVFKKLGMTYTKDEDCGCSPGVVYTITKNEWK